MRMLIQTHRQPDPQHPKYACR